MTKGLLEVFSESELGFWCPGCEHYHIFYTENTYGFPVWDFNGNYDKPTFNPSLLNTRPNSNYRCHLFMRDGKIQYLSDCHHKLAGQTVDMISPDEV